MTLHNYQIDYKKVDREHGAEKGKMVYDREEILINTYLVYDKFKVIPNKAIINRLKKIDKQYYKLIQKINPKNY